MRARSWYLGAVVAAIAGLLVAVPMTVMDWKLNPSGLFHGEEGTNWSIVAETAISWFWPVAAIALVVTVAAHSLRVRTRDKQHVD